LGRGVGLFAGIAEREMTARQTIQKEKSKGEKKKKKRNMIKVV
jgi:hypothetical protein